MINPHETLNDSAAPPPYVAEIEKLLKWLRTGSNASRWPKQASNSRQSSAALSFMHTRAWSDVKRLTPGDCLSVDSTTIAWR